MFPQYSTTTTDADPGAGKFRLNNATIASATELYIDDLEFNGTNVEAWIQSWDDVTGNDTNRGRIRISKANSLDTWMVFKVTGGITNATGYSKVSLVYIDSAGTFTNDDKFFSRRSELLKCIAKNPPNIISHIRNGKV